MSNLLRVAYCVSHTFRVGKCFSEIIFFNGMPTSNVVFKTGNSPFVMNYALQSCVFIEYFSV